MTTGMNPSVIPQHQKREMRRIEKGTRERISRDF